MQGTAANKTFGIAVTSYGLARLAIRMRRRENGGPRRALALGSYDVDPSKYNSN
jgi:hypothetical protein